VGHRASEEPVGSSAILMCLYGVYRETFTFMCTFDSHLYMKGFKDTLCFCQRMIRLLKFVF
jgi:hypothetical protein